MSILTRLRNRFDPKRRQAIAKQQALKQLDHMFAGFNRFEQHRYINVDMAHRRVSISLDLADQYLRQGNDRFDNFIANLSAWFNFRAATLQAEQFFLDIEIKALAKARKEQPNLTRSQEADIRREARLAVDVTTITMPPLPPFTFELRNHADPAEPPTVIGTYHNDELTMYPVGEEGGE